MAYDAAKAHEYYEKYRKKGLLKGRKKGSGKKKTSTKKKSTKTTSLVGLSTAGLNDSGKMQAALIKENLKNEMNAAMSKASTLAERNAIRQEYQNRALSEISKLKSNPSYATAKKASTKSSGSKGTSSGSSKSSSSKSSASSESSGTSKTTDNTTKRNAAIEAATVQAQEQISELFNKITGMSDEERKTAKVKIQNVLQEIKQIQAALAQTTDKIKAIYG